MKKTIGLSRGRKNGNSEPFIKAALTGAAELRRESESIRATDLQILPCHTCGPCLKTNRCAKNNVDWISGKTPLCDDGIILSAPVYYTQTSSKIYPKTLPEGRLSPCRYTAHFLSPPAGTRSIGIWRTLKILAFRRPWRLVI